MTTPPPSSQSTGRQGATRDVGALGAATTGVGAAVVTLVAGACCVSPVLAPVIVGVLGASGRGSMEEAGLDGADGHRAEGAVGIDSFLLHRIVAEQGGQSTAEPLALFVGHQTATRRSRRSTSLARWI